MTRKAFSQYLSNRDANDDYQAIADELEREISTRKRLYDRWLAEGKITWSEGDTRLRALLGAQQYLLQHCSQEQELKLENAAPAF